MHHAHNIVWQFILLHVATTKKVDVVRFFPGSGSEQMYVYQQETIDTNWDLPARDTRPAELNQQSTLDTQLFERTRCILNEIKE